MMDINERLERIERTLLLTAKRVLDVTDVATLLGVTENRVRHLMSEHSIPYYKQGNKVWFDRQELESWQLDRRIPSNAELDAASALRSL
jgi:excisionase family DNA binding protein